jgi:prephenate dehydrogenase
MAGKEITVGIIGLGLIGGSAALRLRQQNYAHTILGFDVNPEHAKVALKLHIVDKGVSLEELLSSSNIVIIAIPVNKALQVLPEVMAGIQSDTVVLDFGSTKEKISVLANSLPNRRQFVACHPIAGTENTGPGAAFGSLFENKVNIICDAEQSSEQALAAAEAITDALGMRVKLMDSAAHDRHIAYVSHMSHISSFILGQTVLEVEKDEENIFDMAGSGFASTVRLAKSSPDMWAPIFIENSENVLKVLDHYIKNLNKFRSLILEENDSGLKSIMSETNIIRKVLEGEKV